MNRSSYIGRVGTLAVVLGVGGVIVPISAAQAPHNTSAHTHLAHTSVVASPTTAHEPAVGVVVARRVTTVSTAHNETAHNEAVVAVANPGPSPRSDRHNGAEGAGVHVSPSMLTMLSGTSMAVTAERESAGRAAPLPMLASGRDRRTIAASAADLPPGAGAEFVTALVAVFISNGDEPGENGGLLIGNGAPGAPGQDGGRGGLLFGNGGRGGDGLYGQQGGDGGHAGLFGVGGAGGNGGNAVGSGNLTAAAGGNGGRGGLISGRGGDGGMGGTADVQNGTATGGDGGKGGIAGVFGDAGHGGRGGNAAVTKGTAFGGDAGDGGTAVFGAGGNGGEGGFVLSNDGASVGGIGGKGGNAIVSGSGGAGGRGGFAYGTKDVTFPQDRGGVSYKG